MNTSSEGQIQYIFTIFFLSIKLEILKLLNVVYCCYTQPSALQTITYLTYYSNLWYETTVLDTRTKKLMGKVQFKIDQFLCYFYIKLNNPFYENINNYVSKL